MAEPTRQVALSCPACSTVGQTPHDVLRTNGAATVRCRECEHVHTAQLDTNAGTRTVRTIVSQSGESRKTTIEVPNDAVFAIGQEFVVDTDDAVFSVEIRRIEGQDGADHERLPAEETATVWTRDIGNVAVDVTIHPAGDEATSRSTVLHVPGDRSIEIGESLEIDGESVRITGIHLREGAAGEAGRKLDERGETAPAKDVNRLYVQATDRPPRSGW